MSSAPSTPISRNTLQRTYRPQNSSPLASTTPSRSSFLSSSINSISTAERRRCQFKSRTPTSSIARSSTLPSSSSSSRHGQPSRTRGIQSNGSANTPSISRQTMRSSFPHAQDTQTQFLRERIKEKCFERARKARARAVKQRRYTGYSDRSSDGFDVDDEDNSSGRMDDDDDEEDDAAVMGDELFRRIMAQTNRKTDHSYRVSYALEVGSSFDPDLEDVAEWEHEVQDSALDLFPPDIDDEELEAYAEDCVRQAVLNEFADIPEEELFHLSDIDDILDDDKKVVEDMDLS